MKVPTESLSQEANSSVVTCRKEEQASNSLVYWSMEEACIRGSTVSTVMVMTPV